MLVVVMGVAGSGKSTVGPLVADALGVPFLDADDFHDDANIERMRAGIPLDDAARAPWLDRLHTALAAHRHGGAVLACSALTASSRRGSRLDSTCASRRSWCLPPCSRHACAGGAITSPAPSSCRHSSRRSRSGPMS